MNHQPGEFIAVFSYRWERYLYKSFYMRKPKIRTTLLIEKHFEQKLSFLLSVKPSSQPVYYWTLMMFRASKYIHPLSLDSKSLAVTDPPTHTNLDTNSFYTYIHSLQIFHRMRISNIHIGKQYFWENDFILFFSYYQPHSLDYVD